MNSRFTLFLALSFVIISLALGRVAFEKLTGLGYRGNIYWTIKNLTLWECQGWCREEPECQAASFRFVLNPLSPTQDTLCLLQNSTLASNPSAEPRRSISLYYMVKLSVRSDNVCNRPWTFERVPNKMIKDMDNGVIYTSTKEKCLAGCLNERRFTCRSCEYNYVTLQCHLSEYDRRSLSDEVELVDAQGVDYFENLCLSAKDSCSGERVFEKPNFGSSYDRISQYVDLYYYVDKEVMATVEDGCRKACELETDFLCRSFLFKGPPKPGHPNNCLLFHLDHKVYPDGADTYRSPARYLPDLQPYTLSPWQAIIIRSFLDNGERIGKYFENVCKAIDIPTGDGGSSTTSSGEGTSSTGEGTSSHTSSQTSSDPGHVSYPTRPTESPDDDDSSTDINCDPTGTCYDVSVHCKDTSIIVQVKSSKPFNGRIYALGRSETCNVMMTNSDEFRLDLTMAGQDCNTQSIGGVYTNTIVIQHHSVVKTKTDKIYKVRCTVNLNIPKPPLNLYLFEARGVSTHSDMKK